MTSVELFAGIGGFRLAAEENGLATIWANDINHIAVEVYRSNFGDAEMHEGDINNLIDSIPHHDVLTGGFPCQPFSKAGKKQGIDDYRGTLFEAIVKVVKRCSPEFFILENVNSLLYMENGRHYRTILKALTDVGYKIEWRVYDAVSFGLPQHRERVIITGSKHGKPFESVLLDSELELSDLGRSDFADYAQWQDIAATTGKFCRWGMAYGGKCITEEVCSKQYADARKLGDILQPADEVPKRFDFTEDTLKRIRNSTYVNKYCNGVQILYNQAGGARMGYSIFGTDGVAPTLTASTSRHYERYFIDGRFRRLTPIEYARLQGFPDDHCASTASHNQYKLYGNAVPPQIISFVMKKILSHHVLEFGIK